MSFPTEHSADTGLWNQTGLGLNLSSFTWLNLALPSPSPHPIAWGLDAHVSVVCRLNELVAPTLCKGPEILWLHSGSCIMVLSQLLWRSREESRPRTPKGSAPTSPAFGPGIYAIGVALEKRGEGQLGVGGWSGA